MEKLVLYAPIVQRGSLLQAQATQAVLSVTQENTRPLRSPLLVIHAQLARPLVVQKDSLYVLNVL